MDQYLPFLLIAVFAVMLFAQSRNRKKNAQQLDLSMQPGVEVMLGGGIIGVIDAIAGDRVLVTTAGKTQLEVTKRAIVRVLGTPEPIAAPVKAPAAKKPAAAAKPAPAKKAAPATKKAK